jgi:hypothetical protein
VHFDVCFFTLVYGLYAHLAQLMSWNTDHIKPRPKGSAGCGKLDENFVNLKDLSIPTSFYMPETGSGSSVREWPVNRDDVRILHDRPFKPKRLDCMFTWGEPLAQWLET